MWLRNAVLQACVTEIAHESVAGQGDFAPAQKILQLLQIHSLRHPSSGFTSSFGRGNLSIAGVSQPGLKNPVVNGWQ